MAPMPSTETGSEFTQGLRGPGALIEEAALSMGGSLELGFLRANHEITCFIIFGG
jgi:hypothetical protein